MYTFILSIVFGVLIGFAVNKGAQWSVTNSTVAGAVVGLAVLAVLTRIFSKRLQTIFNAVNERIMAARDEANKIAQRQGKLSPNVLQSKIEKIMAKAIDEAVAVMDDAKPLYGWAFLAKKQVATSKMQLYYQNKSFAEVDKLLPQCMYFDPLTYAMKMARLYKQGADVELDKTFAKASKRFKGEKAVIIYSTYAWMMIKKKELDKAVEVLGDAKERTTNQDILKNWQAVANNKPNQFNNAFLGEQWYALHLEQPKQKRVKAKSAMRQDPRFAGKVSRKQR